MKVRIPKEYSTLSTGQRQRIEDYCKNVAFEAARKTTEKDGRIMLDLYIKMVCLVLHDAFGFGEKRLNYFLATHSSLFRDQRKKVQNGTQVEYLDKRMGEIFKKNGFPKSFFDKMLGPVEQPDE
jgi:hypothetical protein